MVVVPDRSVSQLLLHLLLNSKQSLASVHLRCNSFGDYHIDVNIRLSFGHLGTLQRAHLTLHVRALILKGYTAEPKQYKLRHFNA